MSECVTGGDCIESIERPAFCAKCEREMPCRASAWSRSGLACALPRGHTGGHWAHPGADPEACSCEESERLKARVAELEDKGYRAAALLIEAQQAASKAEARVRELEQHVRTCEQQVHDVTFRLESDNVTLRVRVAELEAERDHIRDRANAADDRDRERSLELRKAESEARALRAELEQERSVRVANVNAALAAEKELSALREKIARINVWADLW